METYECLNGMELSYMHVFTYSERPGTKAAGLNGKITNAVKKERSRRLHELSDTKKAAFYKQNIGTKAFVLFESDNSGGFMHGFTGNYLKVKTPYKKGLVNEIIPVRLERQDEEGVFIMNNE